MVQGEEKQRLNVKNINYRSKNFEDYIFKEIHDNCYGKIKLSTLKRLLRNQIIIFMIKADKTDIKINLVKL